MVSWEKKRQLPLQQQQLEMVFEQRRHTSGCLPLWIKKQKKKRDGPYRETEIIEIDMVWVKQEVKIKD